MSIIITTARAACEHLTKAYNHNHKLFHNEVEVSGVTIPVRFCGPTFVTHQTLSIYMDGALRRHPSAQLVALPMIGAGRVDASVDYFERVVAKSLPADEPRVIVGQSQGGVVALAYALRHPDTVKHVITIGSPFHGAWLSRFLRVFPAAQDLAEGSPYLQELLDRAPLLAGRVTNIFSPNERVMDSSSCYVDIPGVTNILVGEIRQTRQFLRHRPDLNLDEVIVTDDPVNHLNEMMVPELRAVIWRTVDAVSIANGYEPDGVPDPQLRDGGLLRRILSY